MSAKIELYNLVKEAIATIPEVKKFGKFNNQFDTEGDEVPFLYPAVFYELSSIRWQPSMLSYPNAKETQQQKSEPIEFSLHVGYWSHEDEDTKYLALLEIVEKVYRAVSNIESDIINPCQRVSEDEDNNHTEPYVWTITFSTMLTERGQAYDIVEVSPNIKINASNTDTPWIVSDGVWKDNYVWKDNQRWIDLVINT